MEKFRSETPNSSSKCDTEKGICTPGDISNHLNRRNASGRFGEKKAKDLSALRAGYSAWCGFKENPETYKHSSLPYGKDLVGNNLKSALTTIFNDYSTDVVADKLAPALNSQRNEALNSVVGSKNPKIRFYGVSESNDFRVAYGVAQINLRYEYVNFTLEELNIEPGNFCVIHNQIMTDKVQKDKIRKCNTNFKRRRSQLHSQNCSQTARKESKEGKTYETGIAINLEPTSLAINFSSIPAEIQATVQAMSQEIENSVPKFTPRPFSKYLNYDRETF